MATINLDLIRDKLAYQPFLLGSVAFIAAALLSIANHATHDAIHEAEVKDMQANLAQVMPAGFADNNLLQDVVKIKREDGKEIVAYQAKREGKVVGVVFPVAERGYAGEISLLMAVDTQGEVLGVRVLKHQETPGLGDKIEVAKDPWIRSFSGKSLGNPAEKQWAVKKDGGIFDQFAGATITPRAVVKAVKGGLDFFALRKDELMAPSPSLPSTQQPALPNETK